MRHYAHAVMAALVFVACGGDGGPPDVADAYQEEIDEAWEAAAEGSNPIGSCAVVVGTGVGRAKGDAGEREAAREAYRVCYVDIQARFLEAYAEAIEAGEEDCQGLMISMAGSTGLEGFADDLGVDTDALDAELEERVGDRVRAACPDMAELIL